MHSHRCSNATERSDFSASLETSGDARTLFLERHMLNPNVCLPVGRGRCILLGAVTVAIASEGGNAALASAGNDFAEKRRSTSV